MSDVLLDPKYDLVFKKLFANQQNSKILCSLLNAILANYNLIGYNKIISVTLQNPMLLRGSVNNKIAILDIFAKSNTGEIFNIEMQLQNNGPIVKRSIYYGSKLLAEQIEQGQHYSKLTNTIVIFILNFIISPEELRLHNIYRFQNMTSKRELSDLFTIHYLELPKLETDKENISKNLYEWLIFFNNPNDERLKMIIKTNEDIMKAVELLAELNSHPVVRRTYDYQMKVKLHENTLKEYARQEGRQEGKQEVKQDIVKKMLLENIELDTIAKIADLPLYEINQIAAQNLGVSL